MPQHKRDIELVTQAEADRRWGDQTGLPLWAVAGTVLPEINLRAADRGQAERRYNNLCGITFHGSPHVVHRLGADLTVQGEPGAEGVVETGGEPDEVQ